MKRTITYALIVGLVLSGLTSHAQTKSAKIWATASFNKSSVMLGEPLVVTVTVYTSTWFTQPPVFEEIQVKGALMVKLESRNSATSVTIGRKQYPAIRQQFVVYPNSIGTNTLPPFKVTTTCPPEGDYKGRQRVVSTKERNFSVIAPPEGINTNNWLAAYNVTLKNSWNKPLKNLKAGDVVERRIRISATGALSAAIPPLKLDSVGFGSTYVKTPLLSNRQNKSSFSGTRVEIINYLLEKDGDFVIPELKVKWFKLSTKTLEEATIKAQTISVAENPDLEFTLSRQKELQAELANSEQKPETEAKAPFSLFGLNWWQLLLIVFSLVLLVKLLITFFSRLQLRITKRKQESMVSEAHYFKLLLNTIEKGNTQEIVRALFFWYDRFRGTTYNPYITDALRKTNATELEERLKELSESFYKEDKIHRPKDYNKLLDSLNRLRHNIKKSEEFQSTEKWLSINPQ